MTSRGLGDGLLRSRLANWSRRATPRASSKAVLREANYLASFLQRIERLYSFSAVCSLIEILFSHNYRHPSLTPAGFIIVYSKLSTVLFTLSTD